ncbi:unnamed protein product [Orchesella dallaii]|uniref:C2H2-type domain-containing protein n=1 Tax=Orchesella dallaii TaxID=48710 RepID=A0ABP1PLW0_9HEXA
MANCLFCAEWVRPSFTLDEDGVLTQVKGGSCPTDDHSYTSPSGGGIPLEFEENEVDTPVHAKLKAFFILKAILKIPNEVVEELMMKFSGHLETWVNVCAPCGKLVEQYYQYLQFFSKLMRGCYWIEEDVKGKIKESVRQGKTGGGQVWERIREEVLKHENEAEEEGEEVQGENDEDENVPAPASPEQPQQPTSVWDQLAEDDEIDPGTFELFSPAQEDQQTESPNNVSRLKEEVESDEDDDEDDEGEGTPQNLTERTKKAVIFAENISVIPSAKSYIREEENESGDDEFDLDVKPAEVINLSSDEDDSDEESEPEKDSPSPPANETQEGNHPNCANEVNEGEPSISVKVEEDISALEPQGINEESPHPSTSNENQEDQESQRSSPDPEAAEENSESTPVNDSVLCEMLHFRENDDFQHFLNLPNDDSDSESERRSLIIDEDEPIEPPPFPNNPSPPLLPPSEPYPDFPPINGGEGAYLIPDGNGEDRNDLPIIHLKHPPPLNGDGDEDEVPTYILFTAPPDFGNNSRSTSPVQLMVRLAPGETHPLLESLPVAPPGAYTIIQEIPDFFPPPEEMPRPPPPPQVMSPLPEVTPRHPLAEAMSFSEVVPRLPPVEEVSPPPPHNVEVRPPVEAVPASSPAEVSPPTEAVPPRPLAVEAVSAAPSPPAEVIPPPQPVEVIPTPYLPLSFHFPLRRPEPPTVSPPPSPPPPKPQQIPPTPPNGVSNNNCNLDLLAYVTLESARMRSLQVNTSEPTVPDINGTDNHDEGQEKTCSSTPSLPPTTPLSISISSDEETLDSPRNTSPKLRKKRKRSSQEVSPPAIKRSNTITSNSSPPTPTMPSPDEASPPGILQNRNSRGSINTLSPDIAPDSKNSNGLPMKTHDQPNPQPANQSEPAFEDPPSSSTATSTSACANSASTPVILSGRKKPRKTNPAFVQEGRPPPPPPPSEPKESHSSEWTFFRKPGSTALGFKCRHCPASFKNGGTIQNHGKLHLPCAKVKICTVKGCGWYVYPSQMSSHLKRQHPNLSLRCDKCHAICVSVGGWNEHEKLHESGKGVVCDQCGWLVRRMELGSHERRWHPEEYETHNENHGSSSSSSTVSVELDSDLNQLDGDDYQDPLSSSDEGPPHLEPEVDPYPNPDQNQSASETPSNFEENTLPHPSTSSRIPAGRYRNRFCRRCPFSTWRDGLLEKHVLLHKPGVDTVRCKFCKVVVERQKINYHLGQQHRRNRRPDSSDGIEKEKGVKSSVKTVDKSQIPSTSRSHSDKIENSVNCPECKASFPGLESYQEHAKTHGGGEREACQLCGWMVKDLRRHYTIYHPPPPPPPQENGGGEEEAEDHHDSDTVSVVSYNRLNLAQKRNLDNSNPLYISFTSDSTKFYKCRQCGVRMRRLALLKSHLKKHDEDVAKVFAKPVNGRRMKMKGKKGKK